MADTMKLLETYSATSIHTSKKPAETKNHSPKVPIDKAISKQVGVQFAQTSTTIVASSDGKTHNHITCMKCKKKGHYTTACLDKQAVQLLQTTHKDSNDNIYSHFLFAQHSNILILIPNTWIFLDSQSSVLIFNNAVLLTNIRPHNQPLTIHTNNGSIQCTLIGNL